MKATILKCFWLAIFALFLANSQAQTGEVRGRVIDSKNQPVGYATAAILNPISNEVISGTICDENGKFLINKVKYGEYILSVRMLGFLTEDTQRLIIDSGNQSIEKTVMLQESNQELDEVVIAAKFDFIEQKVDKIVINPNASATSASESIFDILKKVPGVSIDNNDNISLKGMPGITILVDDKPTYLASAELAVLLKGMLGKNVKNIEIIENPSARYDAEGNSGIINIRTVHTKAPGFNGSINSGVTFTRTVGGNAGGDLNMNFGDLNLYGNYSFYDWKGWHSMNARRRFLNESMYGALQNTFSESNSDGNAQNYKVGADYFISKNHVVSIMLRGNSGYNTSRDNGRTSFSDRFGSIDSTLTNRADRDNHWNKQTYNVNYKWDMDSSGSSLTADFDYARFFFDSESSQGSNYFDASGNDLNRNMNLLSTQGGDIDIWSAKLDYVHPINSTIFFETGLKSSIVSTDNRASMTGYFSQNDKFIFEENIQAAYVSGRAQHDNTTLQLGLRLENTISTGTSVSIDQIDKNNYLSLFPSLFIQQTLNSDQSIGLKYSYRIGRPNYHALNPFIWIIDPYTYNLGNPLLNPQFTHALSVNHNFKSMIMSGLSYNYTKDLFTEVLHQNDENNSIYQTTENFGNSIDLNLSETVQLQPTAYWRVNATLIGMFKRLNSSLTSGTRFQRWSYMGNINNSFTLPYKIELELNATGFSEQLLGNFTIKPRYNIDLGIQRRVLKDKGVIKASFSDIFNTGSAGGYTRYENVDIDADNHSETRRVNVSFTYNFGKNQFKTRSNRSTSSSEEESRSAK